MNPILRDLLVGAGGAILATVLMAGFGVFKEDIDEADRERIAANLSEDKNFASLVLTSDDRFKTLESQVEKLEKATVPPGSIVMWSGDITDIPDGWILCDGKNGTPDLRSRFIVGAGGSGHQGPHAKGEADKHDHTIDPPSKNVTTIEAGKHSHEFPKDWYKRRFSTTKDSYVAIDTGEPIERQKTQDSENHKHSVTIDIQQIQSTKSSGENRPRWYALSFIMKRREE